MLTIVLVMLFTLLAAGAVLAYVAFPHRGEDLPVLPEAGRAVRRRLGALPVLDEEEAEEGVRARLP
ncbi:hypothetical protein [Nocardioides solisilvae]|uniref:hypothetical protein n=1 Tax=Nocardioides solisilvae TaxID=1542435 RepID=UPI000D746CCB|nr:hypothetical protein [Nocardioides solisilvae]